VSRVYLSRRNLLTLLSKLDRVKSGEHSECTIVKRDNTHPKYPQTMKEISIIAVEDDVYYVDRVAGEVLECDIPKSGL